MSAWPTVQRLAKGGQNSLPEMAPGGVLVGCDAGTLNGVKIKGNHRHGGMLAAESMFAALQLEEPPATLSDFSARLKQSAGQGTA